MNTEKVNSNAILSTNGIQVAIRNKANVSQKHFARLVSLYPQGLDSRMVVQLGAQRYKFEGDSWVTVPATYDAQQKDLLRIPLTLTQAKKLKRAAASIVDQVFPNPMDVAHRAKARGLVQTIFSRYIVEQLDALLWDTSEYVSVVIDHMFQGWNDFDIDNTSHQQVALVMKYIILSYIGDFRTANECLRLVLTARGHEGQNGSRGSGVVFYEHTDGVHFDNYNEPDLLCLLGLSQPKGSPDTYISPVSDAVSRIRPDFVAKLGDPSSFEVTAPPSDRERHQQEWAPIQILFGQSKTSRIRLDVDLIRAKDRVGDLALGALQQALIDARIAVQLDPGTLLIHRNNVGTHARGKNKADFDLSQLKQRRVFSRSYVTNIRAGKMVS